MSAGRQETPDMKLKYAAATKISEEAYRKELKNVGSDENSVR